MLFLPRDARMLNRLLGQQIGLCGFAPLFMSAPRSGIGTRIEEASEWATGQHIPEVRITLSKGIQGVQGLDHKPEFPCWYRSSEVSSSMLRGTDVFFRICHACRIENFLVL